MRRIEKKILVTLMEADASVDVFYSWGYPKKKIKEALKSLRDAGLIFRYQTDGVAGDVYTTDNPKIGR